ncbi:hypothetical protein CEUSTIGMA_g4298.t1 [Chlamydomonas eustigma]|uniref:Pentapeptide repeat-containing protein n=1 Tax=Chlamydomonas eustigma TaxID=1157962 RepID=A0A250X1U0_9CHLO|nr:hypothetical protein CEUSTIGMA_g4298.t1 [Chlamydomonas eustigma]|eukprot:GAX76852.1 hypothetical protein CEUSTIGMA_g4298.t1 [Chlamydomonas eustigma]
MSLCSHKFSNCSLKCSRTTSVTCRASSQKSHEHDIFKKMSVAGSAAMMSASFLLTSPAMAVLNEYEYSMGGEFGNGTSMQYGEADIEGQDFSGQDLRRSNFTSANAKRAIFKDANLQGAYFIKAVTYKANFENANLSDVLMDRAVINEANLRNAVLTRAVLTRSDLTGADVEGADFTNALVDRAQQLALCKYANGVNTLTGVSTRQSLGCGSMRKFRASAPSNPEGPQVSDSEKDAFRASLPVYRK